MIGRGDEELSGLHCSEIFDEAISQRLDPRHMQPRIPGQVQYAMSLPGPEGPLSVWFTAAPARDRGGRIVGVFETFRSLESLQDTSPHLDDALRAQGHGQEAAAQILGMLADGVFTVDHDMRILSFSEKLEKLTGLTAAEAIGRPCGAVLHGTRCDRDCPLRFSFETGRPVEGVPDELQIEGRRIPVFIGTVVRRDAANRIVGMTGVVRDRSEVEELRREVEAQRGAEWDGPLPAVPEWKDDRAAGGEVLAIRRALARNRWNATRTARDLGISRTTLWRRMKRLDLLKNTPRTHS
jgi:PAS domain S-box-containing protein